MQQTVDAVLAENKTLHENNQELMQHILSNNAAPMPYSFLHNNDVLFQQLIAATQAQT